MDGFEINFDKFNLNFENCISTYMYVRALFAMCSGMDITFYSMYWPGWQAAHFSVLQAICGFNANKTHPIFDFFVGIEVLLSQCVSY